MVVIDPRILSKTVKTMTPKKERVEEAQVRGTVVYQSGEHYIRLDGAANDSLTPVDNIEEGSNDSGFTHGDRVLVLIKNHQAIVTKNLTTGLQANAAKDASEFTTAITDEGITADRIIANDTFTNTIRANGITADEIIAGQAVIDTLDSNYAHITNGVIDNAEIGYADVNGLDANFAHITNGVIDNASISYADVDDLSAHYASIQNGVITNATIDQADVNDLDTYYAHITNGVIDNADIDVADVRNLSANYAHISNGVIDNAKIGHADVNGLNANYAHVTNGVIDNADIDVADVRNLSTTYATIANLEANYAHMTDGVIDNAKIGHADVNGLNANYAHVTNGVIDNAKIGHADVNGLNANYAHVTNGVIDNADIDVADVRNLSTTYATIENLEANYAHMTDGVIDNAKIGHADVNGLNANYAHITNGTIDNAKIGHADVNGLNANYAHITNGTIDNAKIGYANVNDLDAHYAEIDLANVNNAWMQNGVIKNGAIADAQIIGVSANKLTAGTIDASNITVTNLNASNITTGTINGQRIGTGSLSLDKLAEDVYTESEIDGMLSTMQAEIDGAIETFTGTVVPTLNNAPASSWTTAADKAKHVGDVYYVVNAASQADGYCYRFAYDTQTSTYSWVLIKDSDVTAALQRLIDAEGDISDLQEFESETSSWISNTDEELSSIKSNHTSLVTVVNKTVKESVQLWFTKANTTAPSKPTAEVTNNNATGSNSYNKWNLAVPQYNASYPNYFYCYQWKYVDNTFGWSAVTRDIAMGESQERARTAIADAATAQSAAETADGKAVTADGKAVAAQNTANANIKSTVQLWFTKANTTAPNKPTAHVTNNSATGSNSYNKWNIAVPEYNASYPNYFYCYEYQKGDSSYAWSDVVLDKATTENQANARSALTQVATKVETSTFNTLSQTVDSNTANITSLTNTVETKADSSTVTTLSNTVNEVSQTASGNSSKISNLTTVLGTNADGTTKANDIVHKASAIEQDLNGFKTTVSSTYQTKDAMSGYSTTSQMNTAIQQSANAITQSVSETYQTKADMDDYSTTSEMNSAINQKAGEITSSVSQTYATKTQAQGYATTAETNAKNDTTTKLQSYSTTTQMNSAINQKANEITASVASTYTTKADFDALEIGGRNLLTNTGDITKWLKEAGLTVSWDDTEKMFRVDSNHNSSRWGIYQIIDIEPSTEYTLTVTGKNDGTPSGFGVSSAISTWPTFQKTFTTDVQRLSYTFTTAAEATQLKVYLAHEPTEAGHCYYVFQPKLEKGNKATDWTPAPEDLEAYADSAVTTAKAEIKITTDGISSEVSNKVGNNEVISKINQSAESVTIDASKVNIAGAAIFTSGRLSETSLNNAYDANGAAATAKSEAISTAASDATSKANQALTDSKTYVDGKGYQTASDVSSAVATGVSGKADKTAAVSEEQYIYISKASGTSSVSGTTTWVTRSDDVQNTWTTKRPTYNTSYPVLFIAKQKKVVSGTVTCSTPVKDDTTTVIDGGHITTGTIDAARLNVADIIASGSIAVTSDIPTDISDLNNDSGFITSADVPTKVSDLTNDSGFQTASQVSTAVSNGVSGKADKTDAIARTQRIYYRKTSSGAPSKNTTWLATSGTGYGNWSLKVPQLTSGTTKYPYLYTALQTQTVSQQAAGNTCTCSDVLLDDSTTIIDGGNIITGTVNANAINASSGTFDTANIPNLNANKITAGDISSDRIKVNSIQAINDNTGTLKISANKIEIDGEATFTAIKSYSDMAYDSTGSASAVQTNLDNLQIGGKNLLRDTLWTEDVISNKFRVGGSQCYGQWSRESSARIEVQESGLCKIYSVAGSTSRYGIFQDISLEPNSTYTLSADVGETFSIGIGSVDTWPSGFTGWSNYGTARKYKTFTTGDVGARRIYISGIKQAEPELISYVNKIKLEKGNRSTDWSPAPEDLESDVSAISTDLASVKTDYVTKSSWEVKNNEIAGAITSVETSANSYTDGKITTEVNNRNAAITAKANEITASVASTYTTKTDFDNLKIGGRNLLRFTEAPTLTNDMTTGWALWDTRCTATRTSEGMKVESPNASYIAALRVPLIHSNAVIGNEECTLSFWYRTTCTGMSIYLMCDSGGNKVSHVTITPSESEWKYFSATITFNSTSGQTTNSIMIPYQSNCWLEIRDASLKLEKGNSATDWSPAPEDLEAYADAAVTTAKAEIKVTTDKITTEVSKKVGSSEIISSINQSAEEITINAGKVNFTNYSIQRYISPEEFKVESSSLASKTVNGAEMTITRQNSQSDGYYGVYFDIPCVVGKWYSVSCTVSAYDEGIDLLFTFGGRNNGTWAWTNIGRKNFSGLKTGKVSMSTGMAMPEGQTDLRLYIGIQSKTKSITMRDFYISEGDASTVIDGSQILTNSISANKIQTNTITVGSLQDGSSYATTSSVDGKISTVNTKIDNIKIGGDNLISHTDLNETEWWGYNTASATVSNGIVTIPSAGEYYQSYTKFPEIPAEERIKAGEEVTISCYFHENTITTGNSQLYYAVTPSWKAIKIPYGFTGLFTKTFNSPDEIRRFCAEYDTRGKTDNGRWVCGPIKLERGNRATDWTRSSKEVDADISSKRGYHVLQSNYSESYSTLKSWAAEGGSAGSWAVTSSLSDVKVGDTVAIKCTNTTDNTIMYIVVSVTNIDSSTVLRGLSHGFLDAGNATDIAKLAKSTADDAATKATAYITDIDSKNGITVKPAVSTGNDYLQINSSAIDFYRNGTSMTHIEDASVRVGDTSNNATITADGMDVIKGGSSVAAFGVAARIGRDNASRVELESNRISLISENGLPAIQAVTSGKEISTIYAVHALYDRLVGNTNSNVYTINLSAVANTAPFYVTIESRYGYTLTLSTQYTVWSGDFDKGCDSVRIDFTKKSQSESKSATIKMASSISAQYDPNPFVAKTDKSVTVAYNASNSTLTITTPSYPTIADSQYAYGTGTNYITNGDSYLEITVVSAYFSKYIPRTDIYGRTYLDMNTGVDTPDDIDESILTSLNALGWTTYCTQ